MSSEQTAPKKEPVIFAVYAESYEELNHVELMAESLRAFGGSFSQAPIWVYLSESLAVSVRDNKLNRLWALDVEIMTSDIPEDAGWFNYAGKTFAAGEAEADAEGRAEVLVWMDEDTIFLKEPRALVLDAQVDFAYRPVMHNRSGSLASESPDPIWSRIYELLKLDPDKLFTMTTPADRQVIRAYFNAGLLAARPERKVMRGWGEAFQLLYRDPELAEVCRQDERWRIFLHQTALVGPVINRLEHIALHELPATYNYPMFFKKMFGAEEEFDDLTEVATLRYDTYFREPDPNWADLLRGPVESIAWLKDRLSRKK